MKYNFDFKRQLLQGAVAFLVSFLILYFFKGEWDWALALGIGLGNFISTGVDY